MIRLPRLLDNDLHQIRTLRPMAFSLTEKLTPLSMAALTLPHDTSIPMRAFIELFTAQGSAGIFRVTNLRADPGGVTELTLQHGLCTLSDHMHPGESTQSGSLRTLLTKLLANQSRWKLGTVDVPDSLVLTWECNNTNDLQGLLTIMQELPGYYLDFDQASLPWLLHIRAKSTDVECEARMERNLTDVQIEYDSTDMCTLAYADGLDAPIAADTIGQWGEIVRHVSVDEELGREIITSTVERYLEQRKAPRLTLTLTAMELSRITGEPFDSFRKGQLCRCILPEMTAVQRIESIEYPDPIGEPEHVVLTLASTQDDLSVTVAGMVVDIRHVNQLYQQLDKNLRVEAETIDLLAAEIALRATQTEVDGLSTRLSQAEIDLNEVFGQLALRVSYSDLEREMNNVSMLLDAINAELTLKASHSDLTKGLNEVSAELDAMEASIRLLATKEEVSGVSAILSTVQAELNAAEAAITLKASQTSVDELGERVSSAEVRISGAESLISAKADIVRVEALETQISGLVTMDEFEAVLGWSTDFVGVTVSASSIVGGHGDFDELWCGQLNGGTAATQEWVAEQGYLTYVPGNYATQAWVIERGYVTSSDVAETLSNFIMRAELTQKSLYVVTSITKTVNSAGYVTDVKYSGETITYYA